MRIAVLRGLRPTSLIFKKRPHGRWTELDYLLIEAYQINEDETSKSSGLPIYHSRSLDPNISIRIEERVDIADKALAEWDEEHGKKKNPPKGIVRFAVAETLDEDPKPAPEGGLVREAFYKELEEMTKEQFANIEISELDEEFRPQRKPKGGYNASEYGDGIVESS